MNRLLLWRRGSGLALLILIFATAILILLDWSRPRYVFEIRLKTNRHGFAQMFFDIGSGIRAEDSIVFHMYPEKIRTFRLPIPAADYRALRFDPINREGTVTVLSAAFKRAGGELVAEILPANFAPTEQIASTEIMGRAIVFHTSAGATDPVAEIVNFPTLHLAPSPFVRALKAPMWVLAVGSALWLLVAGRAARLQEQVFQSVRRFRDPVFRSTLGATVVTGNRRLMGAVGKAAHGLSDRRAYLLALLPFAVMWQLAYWGIDFGEHWEEHHNKIDAVAYTLEHDLTFLPDGYTYPGVNYWLTIATLSPEILNSYQAHGLNVRELRSELLPVLRSREFALRLRAVFAFVTALTVIWIFAAVMVAGFGWPAALTSSMICATSWEIIYHARWVAPDSILMQFSALTMLLLVVAWRKPSHLALKLSAVAAGLACGTKYPGGLLLLPVLVAALMTQSKTTGWRALLGQGISLVLIFSITYLATTPGTVLQPVRFIQSLYGAWDAYEHGWAGYTVEPGWPHLGKMSVYFSTALFSTYVGIALAFFAFVAVGVWALLRQSRSLALLLLLFPVAYIVYFSQQSAMVVRNYLVVVPFVAFFAAPGIATVYGWRPNVSWRASTAVFVAVLLTINLLDQLGASRSIMHRRDTERFFAEFIAYVKDKPGRTFLVSNRVAEDLRKAGQWPQPNVQVLQGDTPVQFDEYVSYYRETVAPLQFEWKANRPGSFVAVFGPREVNHSYYTGWLGQDRIISISAATAREAGAVPQ